MSDEELRELERKFSETGAVADDVALLRARLRTDPVEEKRLKCAAFLGHDAATQALDISPTPEWELRDTDMWISRLKPLGKEAFVRTVVAIARSRVGVWDLAADARPKAAIEAAEAWALCPCEDHRQAAEKAHVAADEASTNAHPDFAGLTDEAEEAGEAGPDEELEKRIQGAHARSEAADAAALAAKCASRKVTAGSQQDLYQALKNLDPATMPRIVSTALVPWLLGRGDPLRAGTAAAPAPAADDLSAEEKAALGLVVSKLKRAPAALVRELASRLDDAERADLARRIVERRTFDN